MKKIVIILLLSLSLFGCNQKANPKNLYQIMRENKHIIIDVRTEEEYAESHIVASINIPYDKIDKNISIDKEKIIFVYCKSGTRSNIAYKKLISLGYTVYDLGAFDNIDLPKE